MKRLQFNGTHEEINNIIAYMDSHNIKYSPYSVEGYGRDWTLKYTIKTEEEQFLIRMAYKSKGFLP